MQASRRRSDISPVQCRAARALLGITQPELAELSNLGLATIVRLEGGAKDLHYSTPGKVEDALRKEGLTLIDEVSAFGVRLERRVPADAKSLRAEIITAGQCRAARALLNLSHKALAKLVGVQKTFIEAVESGRPTGDEGVERRIRATLVVNGIKFGNEPGAISVRLKHLPEELEAD